MSNILDPHTVVLPPQQVSEIKFQLKIFGSDPLTSALSVSSKLSVFSKLYFPIWGQKEAEFYCWTGRKEALWLGSHNDVASLVFQSEGFCWYTASSSNTSLWRQTGHRHNNVCIRCNTFLSRLIFQKVVLYFLLFVHLFKLMPHYSQCKVSQSSAVQWSAGNTSTPLVQLHKLLWMLFFWKELFNFSVCDHIKRNISAFRNWLDCKKMKSWIRDKVHYD